MVLEFAYLYTLIMLLMPTKKKKKKFTQLLFSLLVCEKSMRQSITEGGGGYDMR